MPISPVRPRPTPLAIDGAALSQIAAIERDKASRTPVQNKLDSQLLYAARLNARKAAAPGVLSLQTAVSPDAAGLVEVDITAQVSPSLLAEITSLGGRIVNSFPQDSAARARLPLNQLEALAADPSVRFIRPAELGGVVRTQRTPAGLVPPLPLVPSVPAREARLARARRFLLDTLIGDGIHRPSFPAGLAAQTPLRTIDFANEMGGTGVGSVTVEGDITHRADLARSTYGIDGTGVKIAVLSDSVDNSGGSYAAAVSSGDVSPVTVVTGQSGGAQSAEGLAMLEIVHHLAPGAQLFFATAGGGQANFANNIRTLRNTYGCDIIIDDYFYFAEAPFQDGTVAKAVNDVTAAGALYFASAGNAGSLDAGTSGVWEGDFADGGAVGTPISSSESGRVHSFGTATYNPITGNSYDNEDHLFWSDPLGGSTNDYDLFLLSTDGTSIVRASTNTQSGTQDPFEYIYPAGTTNQRLVVVLYSGTGRFLHLDCGPVNGGTLRYATAGQTKGHSCTLTAFGVAAVDVHTTSPFPSPFTTADPTISFSSDGLRRIFYNPDGSAITPGNFSATGGIVLLKPEITAANGVKTTLPSNSGLNPFYGTSAASPHAGAIAGLLKSYNPALTQSQVRSIFTGPAAIDNDAPGYDRDAGYGIVDAYTAVTYANTVSGTVTATNGTPISGVTFTVAGQTASTDATGSYTLSPLPVGTLTITPSKAGFNFVPPSRSVVVGVGQPNGSASFTLSQAGIRTSVSPVTQVGGTLSVTVTLANGGANVTGATLTRASLGAASAPSSPTIPSSVGAISTGSATTVTLQYPRSAGASGATVPLRISGTLAGNGSFSGSFQVVLP